MEYYMQIVNKDTLEYVFQSKSFKTPKQLNCWLAKNCDFINFDKYKCYIMQRTYNMSMPRTFYPQTTEKFPLDLKYSYIDQEIMDSIKEQYKH